MNPLPNLAVAIQRYLQETLGASVTSLQPWAHQHALPYFLRDSFDVWELSLFGHLVLVALDRSPDNSPLSEIRRRLDKVSAVTSQRCIYATAALTSFERKRLIEQKVPFIVPGNQLYLPELGIDLREYFRQRASSRAGQISPSAQAMLITALLAPQWNPKWHPAETAAALGYTPMTLSRAIRELAATGIASVHKTGRSQYLRMEFSPQEIWDRVSPLLRSPVQRTIWIPTSTVEPSLMRLAGLNALAHFSILVEPKQRAYAINRTTWHSSDVSLRSPGPMAGYIECQLWNYSPALQKGVDTVDPLSLTLSLRDNADERVQSALEELKGNLPW